MEKKTDIVRGLVAGGDYKKALGIVKTFRLGISREDSIAMTRAYECLVSERFYRSLGVNVAESIEKGVQTLKRYYE